MVYTSTWVDVKYIFTHIHRTRTHTHRNIETHLKCTMQLCIIYQHTLVPKAFGWINERFRLATHGIKTAPIQNVPIVKQLILVNWISKIMTKVAPR